MTRIIALLTVCLFVVSCAVTNVTHVNPKRLLNSSSENVSFALTSDMSIDSIVNWIKEDKPTEATLSCRKDDFLCIEAQGVLEKSAVPYTIEKTNGMDSTITLIYKRISAIDCENGFGCATSVNMLQSVTNRSDFISPPLSDPQDAGAAVDSYNSYFGQ